MYCYITDFWRYTRFAVSESFRVYGANRQSLLVHAICKVTAFSRVLFHVGFFAIHAVCTVKAVSRVVHRPTNSSRTRDLCCVSHIACTASCWAFYVTRDLHSKCRFACMGQLGKFTFTREITLPGLFACIVLLLQFYVTRGLHHTSHFACNAFHNNFSIYTRKPFL